MTTTDDEMSFEKMMAEIKAEKAARAADMPSENDALQVAFRASARLADLGWRRGIYCPKDGTVFEVCNPGRSTGIFRAHYDGTWPTGRLWVHDAGDLWPSQPHGHLWRPLTTEPLETKR